MVQILISLGIFNGIAFNIISGVYVIVARTYDIMLKLATKTDDFDFTPFEKFATTMYVLAGVFMLFRIVIGLVQMLINPDQINDKQAGVGKIATRVIMSIVMLMLFVPNGLLFGQEGLFDRVERALLDSDDGLVTHLMEFEGADENKTSKVKTNISNNSSEKSFLIENVYAAEKADLTCYYYKIKKKELSTHRAQTVNGRVNYDLYIDDVYKIYYYFNPKSTKGLTKIAGSDNYYYKLQSGRIGGANGVKDSNGNSVYYTTKLDKSNHRISFTGAFHNKSKCPQHIIYNQNGKKTWDPENNSNSTAYSKKGIHGGTKTLKELQKKIKSLDGENIPGESNHVYTNNAFVAGGAFTDDTLGNNPDADEDAAKDLDHIFMKGIDSDAVVFAQMTASSLQECTDTKKAECIKAQRGENENGTDGMFKSSASNDEIVKLADSGDLQLGFIVTMIAGIALIVYLMILCVDVLVRKLKLFFLEVIAPLPIISYVNPKDKIFNQWFKMYLVTYVDLFIKLVAIAIAAALLKSYSDAFWSAENWLLKFFYIVAILVFAKAFPSMISKIFGLESMGGSFKDIIGMGKAAAGFGAGAAVGAVTGAMTGKGLGRLSGFAKGAMLGAGAGSKGKVLGGSNAIAAKNARINDAKANGLGFWQRTAAGMAGTLGYNPKVSMDNKIKDKVDAIKMLDEHRKQKDNIEDMAEKSAFLSDLKTQMANGQLGKEEYKKIKKAFIIHVDEQSKLAPDERTNFSIENIKDSKGQKLNLKYTNGQEITGSWAYNDGDADKVTHAIDVAKSSYVNNHALQDEITKSNGGKSISINSYADYLDTEGIATKSRNAKEVEITAVQSSDKYHRAQAFEDYSKSSK